MYIESPHSAVYCAIKNERVKMNPSISAGSRGQKAHSALMGSLMPREDQFHGIQKKLKIMMFLSPTVSPCFQKKTAQKGVASYPTRTLRGARMLASD